MRISQRSVVLSALVMLSATTNVFAQSAAEKSVDQSGNSSKPIEVVVTASRSEEQNTLDVPQSIATVSGEDLAEHGYADVDEALRTLPNVMLAPNEGSPTFWQEGFTIRGLGAQRVLVLTDGVRQAGQGIGYGGGNLSLYDTWGVERIEVLRGAASVLYGTDSFGGVINIISREPKRRTEFGLNEGFRYTFDGSRDGHRIGIYADGGDKDIGAVVTASLFDYDRPNLPDGEEAESGSFRGFNLSSKVDYYLGEDRKLRLLGSINDNRDILINDGVMPLPIATYGAPGTQELVFSPLYFTIPLYQRSSVGLEYSATNLDLCLDELKTGIYWQRLSREFHRETAFYPTGSPGFAGPPTFIDPTASVVRSAVDTDDTVDTFEWQTVGRFGFDEHTVTTGLDLGYDTSDLPEIETQQVAAIAGAGIIDGPVTSNSRKRAEADQYRLGVYAQDKLDFAPFEVTPGVRADFFWVDDKLSDYSTEEFGVSGSLASLYKLDQNNSLFLDLTTGFRAPDLGERFQDGIVNLGVPTRVLGQADLDPERAWMAELGTKGTVEKVKYEVAAFGSFIDNFIGNRSIGFQDGYVTELIDNLGSVTFYGGEISTEVALTEQWDFYANAARTATNKSEKVDVPDWIFMYGTRFTIPVNTWIEAVVPALNFRTVLRSEEKTPALGRDQFDAGGFTVADLMVNFELGETDLGHGKFITGIKNLFDRTYQEPFFPVNQPERSAYVGVEFHF